MPNADITLDINAISLLDGDVKIDGNITIDKTANTRSLTVGGTGTGKIFVKNSSGISILELASDLSKLTIRNSSNVARLELDAAAGLVRVRHSNGNVAAELSAGTGLWLKSSTGSTTAKLLAAGGAIFYVNITMSSGSDIKLDGEFLSSRFADIDAEILAIKARLTAGGL